MRVVLAVALLACLPGCTSPRADIAECTIEPTGQSAMTTRGLHYLMPVWIGEAPVDFLIDTASERSLLDAQLAEQLQLKPGSMRPTIVTGTDGVATRGLVDARVPRLAYAGITRYGLTMAVTDHYVNGERATYGLMGADLLATYDVEVDFAARSIRFFRVSGCGGRFVPWEGDFDAVTVAFTRRRIPVVAVSFNDQPLQLALDTGAARTKISMDAARKLGLDAAQLRATPERTSYGLSGRAVANYVHRFDRVKVGALEFRNLPVSVADTRFGELDGLLGLDFLHTRKVWISYSTRQIFIQRTAAPNKPPAER